MSDLPGLLLLLSPFWLAALLLGVAMLGSRLGDHRRQIVELYVLTPLALLLFGGFALEAALDHDWGRAVLHGMVAVACISFIRKRRLSNQSATPGTGASA